jgi:hypothetical protein
MHIFHWFQGYKNMGENKKTIKKKSLLATWEGPYMFVGY